MVLIEKKHQKKIYKLVNIIISMIIIFILYKNISFEEFILIFRESKRNFLFFGILISFLLGLIGGIRYSFFAYYFGLKPRPSLFTSIKAYFISSSFNLLLPSKLGDLSKGIICGKIDKINYNKSFFTYTIYEKLSDLFALLFIVLILYIKSKFSLSSNELDQNIIQIIEIFNIKNILIISNVLLLVLLSPLSRNIFNHQIFSKISGYKSFIPYPTININFKKFVFYQTVSILIWSIHLFQIILFADSLNMSLLSSTGLLSIGIVILFGLLPISFAGIGTRDIMLIYIFNNYYGDAKPLLLGVLMTSRYILPAIVGLFCMRELTK